MGLFSNKKRKESMGAFEQYVYLGGGSRINIEALKNSALWACVMKLSRQYASLPWKVYRKDGNGGIIPGSAPISELLHKPNRYQSRSDFKFVMGLNFELYGRALAIISRTAKGTPYELIPVPTSSMISSTDDKGNIWYTYSVTGNRYPAKDVLVINNYPTDVIGSVLSPVMHAKNDLEVEAYCKQFQKEYFSGASVVGNLIKTPPAFTDEQRAKVRATFDNASGSGYRNFVVDNRIEVTPIQSNNNDLSKLAEACKMSNRDIANRFSVPLFFVNEMEGSSVNLAEQKNMLLFFSFNPRLRAWEDALTDKLCGEDEYIEFDRNAFVQGTPSEQMSYVAQGLTNGILTPNEARTFIGQQKSTEEGADNLYLQSGFQSLTNISMGYGAGGDGGAWDIPVSTPAEPEKKTAEVQHIETLEERKTSDHKYAEAVEKTSKSARRALESLLRKQTKTELETLSELLNKNGKAYALENFQFVLSEKAQEFTPEFEAIYKQVFTKLLPLIQKQAKVDGNIPESDVDAYVTAYVDSLMGRHGGYLQKQAKRVINSEDMDFEEEKDKLITEYPTNEADEETHRSKNALSLFTFAALGITAYHVVAAPDACNFCQHIDGQTAEVHGYILQKGSEVDDGDGGIRKIDKNYRHPPFHTHCTCTISPGEGW